MTLAPERAKITTRATPQGPALKVMTGVSRVPTGVAASIAGESQPPAGDGPHQPVRHSERSMHLAPEADMKTELTKPEGPALKVMKGVRRVPTGVAAPIAGMNQPPTVRYSPRWAYFGHHGPEGRSHWLKTALMTAQRCDAGIPVTDYIREPTRESTVVFHTAGLFCSWE